MNNRLLISQTNFLRSLPIVCTSLHLRIVYSHLKKIVVFTGSGISAESGIKTFREAGGLWEEYDIQQVATPAAWEKNPQLVRRFYNERRKQVIAAQPNAAHYALVHLESKYHVTIITQNIDDLHEKAGSKNVVHLHGEIMKVRSSHYPNLIYKLDGWELTDDAVCEKGSPLRPNIVWFGEAVPMMEIAMNHASRADIFIVIGTSPEVYPAAGLLEYAPQEIPKYFIDPNAPAVNWIDNLTVVREKAGVATPKLVQQLISNKS